MTQTNKESLKLYKDICKVLGCRAKIRSITEKGFSFIPEKHSVQDAFCIIYKSNVDYHTMTLCDDGHNHYWIEVVASEIPYRAAKYWNGKKYVEYKG